MNADHLRADLLELSHRAAPPPHDLAGRVLHRRRVVRRRRLAMGGAALGVVVVVGLVPVVTAAVGPVDVGGVATSWDQLPTRGPAAGDAAFVEGMRAVPWTYQQWVSPDGTGATMDPQLQPAAGWTSITSDLAAGYPADQRRVLFAGDVAGARWALVVLDSPTADTAAWFSGPVGADPGAMSIAGMPQTVAPGDPLAHVDLANPEQPLVVVTDPGDRVEVSDRAVLEADGTVIRDFRLVPDTDGVVVTTVAGSQRFGVGASVRVLRGGQEVWRSAPSTAGSAAGLDAADPRGWPVGVQTRSGAGTDPGLDYLDEAVVTALGPFGLSLGDLEDPELVQVFESGVAGLPVVTVYSIGLPSGARVLVGGWTNAPGDTTPSGRRPDQGVGYVDTRPADRPVADDVVAVDLLAGTRRLLISGPERATDAVVLGADGTELLRIPLVDGMAAVSFPAGSVSVRVLDGPDPIGPAQDISAGQITTWGDDGSSPTTSFTTPIPPPN